MLPIGSSSSSNEPTFQGDPLLNQMQNHNYNFHQPPADYQWNSYQTPAGYTAPPNNYQAPGQVSSGHHYQDLIPPNQWHNLPGTPSLSNLPSNPYTIGNPLSVNTQQYGYQWNAPGGNHGIPGYPNGQHFGQQHNANFPGSWDPYQGWKPLPNGSFPGAQAPRVHCKQFPKQFTPELCNILLKHFEENNYPKSEEHSKIAQETGLETQQVRAWFERRRRLLRKAGNPPVKRRLPEKRTYQRMDSRTLACLMDHYNEDPQPNILACKRIGEQVGRSPKQVRDWFNYERKKEAAEQKKNETLNISE